MQHPIDMPPPYLDWLYTKVKLRQGETGRRQLTFVGERGSVVAYSPETKAKIMPQARKTYHLAQFHLRQRMSTASAYAQVLKVFVEVCSSKEPTFPDQARYSKCMRVIDAPQPQTHYRYFAAFENGVTTTHACSTSKHVSYLISSGEGAFLSNHKAL